MYTHLINRWDAIRDSFWFLPMMMCAAGFLLAISCARLDGPFESWILDSAPWVAVSTPAARSSLAAIGSAMVSIAGIVFSVTLVTLSITSSQYGSRLLRTFMSDRVTQFALGMLIGTSLFTMTSLACIHDSPEGASTANASVIVGLCLAIASLATLIAFIHHVASLIQAPNVVAAVAVDVNASFDRVFPAQAESVPSFELTLDEGGSGVKSGKEGYLQAIDIETLLTIAKSLDLFLRLRVKPGDFVERDQRVMDVWPCEAAVPGHSPSVGENQRDFGSSFTGRINETLITGRRRTPRQDSECALEELVEVAVRALSPGINDPFTAVACIDHIAAALGRVGERSPPAAIRVDDNDIPRVLMKTTEFEDLMDTAFNPLRQHGGGCVAVSIRMLEAFSRIAQHMNTNQKRESVCQHAEMLRREFRTHVEQPEDGDDFDRHYQQLIEVIEADATEAGV